MGPSRRFQQYAIRGQAPLKTDNLTNSYGGRIMSRLTDGYNEIIKAIEDWMFVIREEMKTNFNPSLVMLHANLEILMMAHQSAIPHIEDLERIFASLGLKPREPSISTESLDDMWGETHDPQTPEPPEICCHDPLCIAGPRFNHTHPDFDHIE